MVKGPGVAVMNGEAGSHVGVHDTAPLGGLIPSAGQTFDVSHQYIAHGHRLPDYPPIKENGNPLGKGTLKLILLLKIFSLKAYLN